MPASSKGCSDRAQGSPIAEEAIGRIAQLYAVEKEARGSPPDIRVELCKAHAAPVFDDMEIWLALQLITISGKSSLAAAIRCALTRMERLRPYLDHGILDAPTPGATPPHGQTHAQKTTAPRPIRAPALASAEDRGYENRSLASCTGSP